MKNTASQVGPKASVIPKVNASMPEGFVREIQIKVITGTFVEYGSVTGGNHWIESLNRLSDQQVSKLKDICDGFEEKLHVGRLRIGTDVKHVETSVLLGDGPTIDFYHRYRNEATGAYSYIQMDAVRKTLKKLGIGGSDPREWETMDSHIRASMTYVPLTKSTDPNAPFNTYEYPVYSQDKKLVKFVERYPDRVDDIMRFRTDRNSSTYTELEQYFKEADKLGTPAIMRGWL
jgi:hypothetical protein